MLIRLLGCLLAIERQLHAVADRTKAQQEAREPRPPGEPLRVSAEINFPKEQTDRYDADQQKSRRLQWLTLWISVLTLIVLTVYTCVTIGLWKTANHQMIQSQRAIEIDQRAWLSVGFQIDKEPKDFSAANAITISVPIANTGKTPATRVRVFIETPIQNEQPQLPNWAEMVSQAYQTAGAFHVDPSMFLQTMTVFPGEKHQVNSLPIQMAPTWLSEYQSHGRNIWIWVRIDYCDVFGKPHWTQACAVHVSPDALNISSFHLCATGNETDDGKAPTSYKCD
jgi:hypothetical protein